MLNRLGVRWLCVTGGSPYYCPHVQRPALFPPSDGYEPPEDPLVGVARHINITSRLKAAAPAQVIVGSGYSYLQEWLPNVAQAVIGARPRGLRRPRPHGALVPGAAGRRAGRQTAAAQVDLSHVQRLHHRSPQRARVRVLSRSIRSTWRIRTPSA